MEKVQQVHKRMETDNDGRTVIHKIVLMKSIIEAQPARERFIY